MTDSTVMKTPLLTRQMSEVLDAIKRANRPPFYTLTAQQARIAYEAASEVLELPRVSLPRIENFDIRAGGGTMVALGWLSEHAGTVGLDGSRLAVGGDSAGGTLAAVSAIHARDIGLKLAMQILITPGTAALQDSNSHRIFGSGFLLEGAGIEWFFDQYIDPNERHDWRFAPLEAGDVDGIAPALVVLAECDPLVDEGIAYADKLRAAGVSLQLELYRGVTHDFIKMGRAISEAAQAQEAIAQALKRAFEQ